MEQINKTNFLLAGILFLAIVLCGLFVSKVYFEYKSTTDNNSVLPTPISIPTIATNFEPTPAPFEQAIDSNVLRSLSMIKKGILQESILTNTYTGAVVNASTIGGVLPNANNFKYKIKIVIRNNQGEINSFYYNDREASIMRGDISMFNVGDSIKIQETIDLQKDQTESITALTITKL